VGRFSKAATAVSLYLLEINNVDSGFPKGALATQLGDSLTMDPEILNDAVDELGQHGLIRLVRERGTFPFRFTQIEPTYVLYQEFTKALTYDPNEDAKVVACAIAALRQAEGPALRDHTQLSLGRLNRAVDYLAEYGVIDVERFLNTGPLRWRSWGELSHSPVR
jgi:hypothetical protein